MRDIAKNLKDARMRKGITQEELAEKLFVTRQTVSSYELGRTRPDVEMLMRIAEVLQTDLNALIYGEQVNQDKKRKRIVLIYSIVILAALTLVAIIVHSIAEKPGVFAAKTNLTYWLHMAILPGICFVGGWTVLQMLGLFLDLKKVRNRKYRWVKVVTIAILIPYVIVVSPYLLGETVWSQLPNGWNTLAYIFVGTHSEYNRTKMYLLVFILLGGIAWVFPWINRIKQVHTTKTKEK